MFSICHLQSENDGTGPKTKTTRRELYVVSKAKCDRSTPCNNCSKSKIGHICDYAHVHVPVPANTPSSTFDGNIDADNESHATLCAPRSAISSPFSALPASPPVLVPVTISESASCFIQQLYTKTDVPGVSDAFYVQYGPESETAGAPQPIPRLVSHKTRSFGLSHWISPCIMLYGKQLIGILAKTIPPQTVADVQRCKSLARIIKARRAPPWPTIPTRDLPPRDVADALVDCYFQTSEVLYRVLHIPSFRQAYATLWEPAGEEPTMALIMQVKLVLAIGATTYDDEFSLRCTAMRWIQEAMTWNSSPHHSKSRLTLQGLQNSVRT